MRAPDRRGITLAVLGALALASVAGFMTLGVKANWAFVLQFRGTKLVALVLVAYSIAVSTVLFQTVTNNRILTPSIMGFDALFVLIQTLIVFFLGSAALAMIDVHAKYMAEVAVMTVFAGLLFRWLFVNGERSLHMLVLVGIVFGVLFRNLAGLMQRLIDPNEFTVLQDSLFASFNTVDARLVWISLMIVIGASLLGLRVARSLDVLTLGRAQAVGLGVNYRRTVAVILAVVAVLVSVSTALVGPITFFGLLVVSLAHVLMGSGRHVYILPASVLLAIICLVGGQTILERVFAFDTALSIIIEFLGGTVFIILLLKGAAAR